MYAIHRTCHGLIFGENELEKKNYTRYQLPGTSHAWYLALQKQKTGETKKYAPQQEMASFRQTD